MRPQPGVDHGAAVARPYTRGWRVHAAAGCRRHDLRVLGRRRHVGWRLVRGSARRPANAQCAACALGADSGGPVVRTSRSSSLNAAGCVEQATMRSRSPVTSGFSAAHDIVGRGDAGTSRIFSATSLACTAPATMSSFSCLRRAFSHARFPTICVASLLSALAFGAPACGSSGSSGLTTIPADGGGDGGNGGGDVGIVAPDGGAALVVVEAAATERNATRAGRLVVSVTFDIANGANSEPLPLAFALFAVTSSDGLEVPAITGTGDCPAEARLVASTRRRCTIVAELLKGASPTLLRYAMPTIKDAEVVTRHLEAPIRNYRPCTPCKDVCVDVQTDIDHCGQCGASVKSESNTLKDRELTCDRGIPTCPRGLTYCPMYRYELSRCADLQKDAIDCGACGRSVMEGACQNGSPVCASANQAPCPNGSDDQLVCRPINEYSSCGSCGKTCNHITYARFDSCTNGVCRGWVRRSVSCDQDCTAAGFDRAAPSTGGDCQCEGTPR